MCGVQRTLSAFSSGWRRVAQRLLLEHVECRHARPTSPQRGDERARFDQARTAGVDEQRARFHPVQIRLRDDAARSRHEPHVQRQHVAVGEEALLARSHLEPVGARPLERLRPRPRDHLHAERGPVAGDDLRDPAVAVETERLPDQRVTDARLPLARPARRDLLRDLPHRREHQSPGELCGRVRRRTGVHVRAHRDAEARARLDVDVRVDAALTDQTEVGQAFEQRRADLGALADQDKGVEALQPLGEGGRSPGRGP